MSFCPLLAGPIIVTIRPLLLHIAALAILYAVPCHANDAQELAKKLSNPISSLISAPFQYNYDQEIGPADEGRKHVINFQPVIPVSLNADWTLISRTVVPIVADQHDLFPLSGDQSGLSDTLQSFFLSPKQPSNGIIWGVGPALLIPTGTNKLLSGEKWGAGPTAVVLTQQSGWTIGALANHIWSIAGDEQRADVSSTFLQPFISYTTADAWTFGLNTESTFDWTTEEWAVPINLTASKLTSIGQQPVSLGAGVRYWADSPETGAVGWGVRATVTFLFPTGG